MITAAGNRSSIKEASEKWDAFRINMMRSTPIDISETEKQKRERVEKLKKDFPAFCKYYWPQYASAEFANFHLKFAKKLAAAERIYMVRAWAREHAKSVVAGLFIPLFEMVNGRLENMLLVSHSYDNACELLMPVMISLESNHRFINDFGQQKSWRGWETGRFVTAAGCSFRALGAGQSPRGSRNEEKRPDFILIDDIDTDAECRNDAQIKKKWDWIEQALFPTMSISGRKRFVIVGNIIGKNSVVVRASKKADDFEQINILDSKGKPSWSSRYTLDDVNYMLSKISYASGQKEYFNNPISEGSVFKELVWGKVPPVSKFPFLVLYTDPSYKEGKKNDFKGTMLIGQLDGKFYILKSWLEQTTTAKMVEWHHEADGWVAGRTAIYMYIEKNLNEDTIRRDMQTAEKSGKKVLSVTFDDRAKPEKFTRIESTLEPLNRTGQLIFNEAEKENPHMQRLEEQFKAIEPSLPAHDDGPDAVEGGVWIINNKLRLMQPIKVGVQKRTSKKF